MNFNRHGIGDNNQGNNDPFSKTKFKIPHFSGSADPEAYLDWEMTVDQKFSSHQVPEEYRVRLATSELLVLLFSGGMIFAIMLMLMLMLKYLKPRLYLNDE